MTNQKAFQVLARRYHLDLLILFGSLAKKETHAGSDVDLAFFRMEAMDSDKENRLWEDLMALLKREDVDLINISTHHNVVLRYQIFMEGEPLYKNMNKILLISR